NAARRRGGRMNRCTGILATMAIAVACGGSIDRPEVANAGVGHREGRNAMAETSAADQGCVYTSWSAPINMGSAINSAFNDSHAALTKDELSLYITSTRVSQNAADEDIFVSQRSSLDAAWGTPVRLGPNVNTVCLNDSAPNITPFGRGGHHAQHTADGRQCLRPACRSQRAELPSRRHSHRHSNERRARVLRLFESRWYGR